MLLLVCSNWHPSASRRALQSTRRYQLTPLAVGVIQTAALHNSLKSKGKYRPTEAVTGGEGVLQARLIPQVWQKYPEDVWGSPVVLLPGVSQMGFVSELHIVHRLIPGAVFRLCSLTANLVPFSSFNYSNSSYSLPVHPLWYTRMVNVICSGRTRWSLPAGSSDFSLRTWQMLSAEWSLWVILAPFCFLFSYFCMAIP